MIYFTHIFYSFILYAKASPRREVRRCYPEEGHAAVGKMANKTSRYAKNYHASGFDSRSFHWDKLAVRNPTILG